MPMNIAISPSATSPVGKDIRQQWVVALGLDPIRCTFEERKDGRPVRRGWIEQGTFLPDLTPDFGAADWIYELGVVGEGQSFLEKLLPYPFNLLPRGGGPIPLFPYLQELEAFLSLTEIGVLAGEMGSWHPSPVMAHFIRGQCQRLSTFPELDQLVHDQPIFEVDSVKLKDFFGTQTTLLYLSLDPAFGPEKRLENALKIAPVRVEFRLTSQDSKPFTL